MEFSGAPQKREEKKEWDVTERDDQTFQLPQSLRTEITRGERLITMDEPDRGSAAGGG